MALEKARRRYFDPTKKGSLSSKKTFAFYNKDIAPATIDRLFASENSTRRWFPNKLSLKGETLRMRANYFGQFIMADTGFFSVPATKVGDESKKVIVLGICDVFSRCFFARILSRATGQEAIDALKAVIQTEIRPFMFFKDRPITILTDMGGEFVNRNMTSWLQSAHRIDHHTLSSSASKAAIIERKWRTLKSKVQLFIDSRKVGDKIDFPALLESICATLNDTASRVLADATPNQIRKSELGATNRLREKTQGHLYWSEQQRVEFYQAVKRKLVARIGQYTRITAGKAGAFQKQHDRRSSKLELFIVHRIKLPIPAFGSTYSMYALRDLNDEVIRGYFKTSEIIPVPDSESPFNKGYRYTVVDWERDGTKRGFYNVQLAGNHALLPKYQSSKLPEGSTGAGSLGAAAHRTTG